MTESYTDISTLVQTRNVHFSPFFCRHKSIFVNLSIYKEQLFCSSNIGINHMERKKISSGTQWEAKVGYSRAVRARSQIFVSGTTATDKKTGAIIGQKDAYAQTIQAIRNIEDALKILDSGLNDVIRTRMYVDNIKDDWENIAKAHAELFENINPATTMVEVKSLISPEILVEIEADAIVNDP